MPRALDHWDAAEFARIRSGRRRLPHPDPRLARPLVDPGERLLARSSGKRSSTTTPGRTSGSSAIAVVKSPGWS
ncbi:hypothetical protein [Streptomyces tailanensis]|uniref:hypothetical protein n=1 Tax=Streptomyces tailanensis TaxID=2569858 RepID=UPI00155A7CE8|nr:hypothetical protein [Streptomyces tailanensis]